MAGVGAVKPALLDTDILSGIGKARDPIVADNAKSYRRSFGQSTLSAVSVTEIVRGLQRIHATARLSSFVATLPPMEVLPLDHAMAELAGRIAGELERVGRPIGTADSMITATAITHGLELVTGNTAHFQRVPEIGYPLILANWRHPLPK